MSYAAYVPCACYRDGLTPPPPYEEHVRFEEGHWELRSELYDEVDEDRYYEMTADFAQWRETACEHEDMEIVSEQLGNALGTLRFGRALDTLPEGVEVPILKERALCYNDGGITAEESEALLRELALVRQHEKHKSTRIGLYWIAEKHPSYTTVPGRYTVFGLEPIPEGRVRRTWLDENGICVFDPLDEDDDSRGYERFRSCRFEEVVFDEPKEGYVGGWRDLATDAKWPVRSLLAEHTDDFGEMPVLFEVRREEVALLKEEPHVFEKLERLARAGVETGYGVWWA